MRRTEQQIYIELQDAKGELAKTLERIAVLDGELGGTNTYESEVMPIVKDVFPEDC